MPSTRRAVCSTAGDPHSPISPTATRLTVWGRPGPGPGEGPVIVRGESLPHATVMTRPTQAAQLATELDLTTVYGTSVAYGRAR